jgi:hypothetical protein
MKNADYSNCKNRQKDLLVSKENIAINPSETLYMHRILGKSLLKNKKRKKGPVTVGTKKYGNVELVKETEGINESVCFLSFKLMGNSTCFYLCFMLFVRTF